MTLVTPDFRFVIRLVFAAFLLLSVTAPSGAQRFDALNIDELFDNLQSAPNEATAEALAQEIWRRWLSPEDPDLNVLLANVIAFRQAFNIDKSLEITNQIIEDFPDYAEGWNQRATIHYMKGEFQASLDDIEEVLVREPRHFGALSGRVLVYLGLGDRDQALKAMIEALHIHPYLATRSLFPQLTKPAVRI